MTAYTLAVGLHVSAGSIALLTFWIAALIKKGTPRHRRVGQIYLSAMAVVIVSGVPLVFAALQRGAPISAIFLGYLLLLTGIGCWSALRAIRDRRDRRAYFSPFYWTLIALLAATGTGLIVLGISVGAALLSVFGGVGLFSGIRALHASRRAATDPKWWLKEHYGAMIGNGVATHIAFLGIGLRNLPGIDPQLQQSIAWFGPLACALVATWWLGRRYGGKPSAPRVASAAGALSTH